MEGPLVASNFSSYMRSTNEIIDQLSQVVESKHSIIYLLTNFVKDEQ